MNDTTGQKLKERQASIAEASLPLFGLSGGSLTQLQQLVNTSFQVQHESGDYYLRVYNLHRRSWNEIKSELTWMEALAKAELSVPTPRRTVDDQLSWQSPNRSEVQFICVTSWLDGQVVPGDERSSIHYASVGHLLAEVHQHATSWNAPAGFARPYCDAKGIYRKLDALTLRKPEALDSQLQSELEKAQDALLRTESIIGRAPERYGLVHGDPSFGNILFKDDRPSLIDFDDCGYGFFVSDLAVVLAGAWGKARYTENRAALLDGYQKVRPLLQAEIDALPLMMAARAASLILWAAETSMHLWIEGQWQRLREYIKQEGCLCS